MSNESLRLNGPNQTWRNYVSGLYVENYTLAQSIWNKAKSARSTLGREQKMPSAATKLKQPIWGTDRTAIARWIASVVNFGSTQKLVIQFNAELNYYTNSIQLMDYCSFAWGPYKTSPINGWVTEISPDIESGTIAFTMLCKGDFTSLPVILSEAGEAVQLETGELMEAEDPSLGSIKISEMNPSSAGAAAAAGAEYPVAITGIGNYRVSLNSTRDWLQGVLQHDLLDGIDEGDIKHLSAAQKNGLTNGGVTTLHTHSHDTLTNKDLEDEFQHIEAFYKEALYSNRFASGVITLPTVTKGSGGVINVGADGIFAVYDNPNFLDVPILVNPGAVSLTLTDSLDQWLTYTYGIGYEVKTCGPDTVGLMSSIIPVIRYQYQFGRIHTGADCVTGNGQSERLVLRSAFTDFYSRVRDQGLGLTLTPGTQAVIPTIGQAYVYNGAKLEFVQQFTVGPGKLYRHSIASSVWSETEVPYISTITYNPSTGMATLPVNKWAWAHIYRSIGDDIEAFVIYGSEYYSTEKQALDSFSLPSSVTAVIASHCLRVASILFMSGATTAKIISAFDTNALTSALTIDAVPTDGSDNPVASNGVFDALATKEDKYLYYTNYVETNAWWKAVGFRITKAGGAYADAGGLILVEVHSSVDSSQSFAAHINVFAKNQNNVYTSTVQAISGNTLSRDKIRYWVENDATYYTVWIIPYMAAYCRASVKILQSYNSGAASNVFTTDGTSSYTAIIPLVSENFVTQNDGTYGNAKLVSAKSNYYGLSAPGSRRVNFMSAVTGGAAGIYDETNSKWIVLKLDKSGIETDYRPANNSSSTEIATTNWAMSKCIPLRLSASAIPDGNYHWFHITVNSPVTIDIISLNDGQEYRVTSAYQTNAVTLRNNGYTMTWYHGTRTASVVYFVMNNLYEISFVKSGTEVYIRGY